MGYTKRLITAEDVIDRFTPWGDSGEIESLRSAVESLEKFRNALIKIMPPEMLVELVKADRDDGEARAYDASAPGGYVELVASESEVAE